MTSGSGVLDRHSAAVADTFDSKQLDALPSSRSMAGLIGLAHAVYMPSMEVGAGLGLAAGTFSAYGRNNSPRHTIEGIVVTGLFGAGFTPDYGALEEMAVTDGRARRRVADRRHSHATRDQIGREPICRLDIRRLREPALAVVQRRCRSDRPLCSGWRRSLGHAGEPDVELSRRQRRCRRLRRPGPAVVVLVDSRPGNRHTAGELSGRAVSHAVDELQRQGHRARRARPHARRLRTARPNDQPYSLDPFGPPGGDLSAATAINESLESTARQRNVSRLWKGEWDAVLTDTLLFDVRVGQFGNEQDWSREARIPDSRTSKPCSSAAAVATGIPAAAATSCLER